jgi:hypothetical protein
MSTRTEQVARFWSNYLAQLGIAQVRADQRRWYVLRAERFVEAIQPQGNRGRTTIPNRYGFSDFNYSRMISKCSVSSERNCTACASRSAKNRLQAAL